MRKLIAFVALGLIVVAIPVTVIIARNQQEVRQFASSPSVTPGIAPAWSTNQSATAICSGTGEGVIQFSFTNEESSRSMDVVVVDQQTNISLNLGTIAGKQTKTGQISTGKTSLQNGTIIFNLTWTNDHSQTDHRTVTYQAINCSAPTPTGATCQVNQSLCEWTASTNAVSYHYIVVETTSGSIIKEGDVNAPQTSISFPTTPGKSYSCVVTPTNSCGVGQQGKGSFTCALTPTPSICVTPPPIQGVQITCVNCPH